LCHINESLSFSEEKKRLEWKEVLGENSLVLFLRAGLVNTQAGLEFQSFRLLSGWDYKA
jgi:hypothetical protein